MHNIFSVFAIFCVAFSVAPSFAFDDVYAHLFEFWCIPGVDFNPADLARVCMGTRVHNTSKSKMGTPRVIIINRVPSMARSGH
ncbi:hypothetical protein F5148DRAFT_1190306 [Russula earlei]|uniref:Uncharacterized protein n=1 Tax=Russula earlei TaxID=71964 RepID=A0ACC0UDF8_9AGAM|nr:hypothetical protein F5148DRAFT_1190306 [Russula earlei]